MDKLLNQHLDKPKDGKSSKMMSLSRYHYDFAPIRGVIVLDNRWPDDFGNCFYLSQEPAPPVGIKYDTALLDRRRYFYFGEINHV